jgi:gas vesicle protein
VHTQKNGGRWIVAGLGLGVLTGILLAPQSGRETRKALARGVDDGIERAATVGRQARRQIRTMVGSGKRVLARKKEQVGAAVDAVKGFLNNAA